MNPLLEPDYSGGEQPAVNPLLAALRIPEFKQGLLALMEDPRRAKELGMVKSAVSGATLPGDVYAGREDMPLPTDMSQEQGVRVADMAGLAMTGGLAGGPKGAVGSGPMRRTPDLPMDEVSRMARAKELGYDTRITTYHGSPDARGILQEGGGFNTLPERYGGNRDSDRAFFFADDFRTAKSYADPHRAFDYQGSEPAVIAAHLRMRNPKIVDWEGKKWSGTEEMIKKAKQEGYDGVVIKNVIDTYQSGPKDKPTTVRVVFEPDNIRSPKAAFDPLNEGSGFLLGAGANPSSAGLLSLLLNKDSTSAAP